MGDVAYFVPLVAQPTDTSCWAAALDMIVSYRDSTVYFPEYIASQADMSLDEGYGWDEIRSAVAAWNLREDAPASGTVQYWTDQLQQFGPIWVVETGNPYHAVVLTAISGTDEDIANAMVSINNPAPVGQGEARQTQFLLFEDDFELGAGAGASMVHV